MSKRCFIIGGIVILIFVSLINLSYPKEVKEAQPKQIVQDVKIEKEPGETIEHENEKLVEKKIHQDDFNNLKSITESFYHEMAGFLWALGIWVTIILSVLGLLMIVFGYLIPRHQIRDLTEEWERFAKEESEKIDKQKSAILDELKETTEKDIEGIKETIEEEQKERNWIEVLQKEVKDDPYLEEDSETVKKIKEHCFKDQRHIAWEFYGVGRYFDKVEERDLALKHFRKAAEIEHEESELSKHIYQSMGKILSDLADKYLEKSKTEDAIGKYKEAIEAFEKAYEKSKKTYAYSKYTIGNAHIGLAKTYAKQREELKRDEEFDAATRYFDKAIDMEDRKSKKWWGNFHYSKAAVFALRKNTNRKLVLRNCQILKNMKISRI